MNAYRFPPSMVDGVYFVMDAATETVVPGEVTHEPGPPRVLTYRRERLGVKKGARHRIDTFTAGSAADLSAAIVAYFNKETSR